MDYRLLSEYKDKYQGKRLAAFDFGLKRIGFAVCDEFHISITPKTIFYFDDQYLWDKIADELNSNEFAAIIVGVPYPTKPSQSQNSDLMTKFDLNREIELFIEKLSSIKLLSSDRKFEIVRYDESFSSKRAVRTMLEIGTKKKNRRIKENIDKVSAAIILRDFLLDMDGI